MTPKGVLCMFISSFSDTFLRADDQTLQKLMALY